MSKRYANQRYPVYCMEDSTSMAFEMMYIAKTTCKRSIRQMIISAFIYSSHPSQTSKPFLFSALRALTPPTNKHKPS